MLHTALKIINNKLKDKGNIKKSNAIIENVIGGKLDYLKMIEGTDSTMYKKLYDRYDKLMLSIKELSHSK